MARTFQFRRGMQMVEVAVASVVVALLLVSSLNLLSASLRGSRASSRLAQAASLAESLMSEIDEMPFSWPPPETISAKRNEFAALGEFQGWTASPPVDRDGTAIASDSWRRTVSIRPMNPMNVGQLLAQSATDAEAVLVNVTVEHNDKVVKVLSSLRFKSWDDSVRLADEKGQHVDVSNQPPMIVVRQAGPLTGTSPLTVTFDVSDTVDPDGDSLTYEWDFGDSTPAVGNTMTHVFTNATGDPSSVNTVLTVTDAKGAVSQKAFPVHLDFE